MSAKKPEDVQIKKRQLLLLAPLTIHPSTVWAGLRDTRKHQNASTDYRISLPKDHGAHTDFKTEWWYFTGWLERVEPPGSPIGIQITFFRNSPTTDLKNPSRFTPSQLLFAHAAIALPENQALVHEQIALRAGAGDSVMEQSADQKAFRLRLGSWQLALQTDGIWRADISTPALELTLQFKPTQLPWLQGEQGYSRKGPKPEQASHYITLPQLHTTGHVRSKGKQWEVKGKTWMDHEWSTAVLDPRASGWDWVGLNGADGSSLVGFVIREKAPAGAPEHTVQSRPLWQHAELRKADGTRRVFKHVAFQNTRTWVSPKTGVHYPVEQQLQLDELLFEIKPLIDDQELDARASTGTIYWEGAVQVHLREKSKTTLNNPEKTGTVWGHGYLELTGYWKPLQL